VKPEPLLFPRGVRVARLDELPVGAPKEFIERLSNGSPPAVTTGYRVQDESPNSFLEANVHADRVFEVVRAVAVAILPNVAAPIVGIRGEDPVLGPYTWKNEAIRVFEPFVEQLQHDGFLEFGLMFQYKGETNEVFVRSAKYLQIWTTQLATVRRVLEDHGISEVRDLSFIDEYPTTYKTLSDEQGTAGWPLAVDALREAFAKLEQIPPPGA
jgi:hypothetical protein